MIEWQKNKFNRYLDRVRTIRLHRSGIEMPTDYARLFALTR